MHGRVACFLQHIDVGSKDHLESSWVVAEGRELQIRIARLLLDVRIKSSERRDGEYKHTDIATRVYLMDLKELKGLRARRYRKPVYWVFGTMMLLNIIGRTEQSFTQWLLIDG